MALPMMPNLAIQSSSSAAADGKQSQFTGPKMVNFAAPGGNSTLLIGAVIVAAIYLYTKKGKK